MKYIRNIEHQTVFRLNDEVEVRPGQVVSKTLAQNDALSLTVFAFAKGEAISSHDSEGDALVTCLEGKGRLTVGGEEYVIEEGESLAMPATIPHAVYAVEDFKMLLSVVFPEERP